MHMLRKYEGNPLRFQATIIHLKYELDKIVHSEVISQELDCNSSEGQDCNWEDYD